MRVDVESVVVIDRPRDLVATFAADPDNATRWYENIRSVEWETPRPAAVGSRIAFVARFLGRRIAYTYEIRTSRPREVFVMRTHEPFPMVTTYRWEDTPAGGTRMTLRNSGDPTGFSRLVTPMISAGMRRANRKDLRRLKSILEAQR